MSPFFTIIIFVAAVSACSLEGTWNTMPGTYGDSQYKFMGEGVMTRTLDNGADCVVNTKGVWSMNGTDLLMTAVTCEASSGCAWACEYGYMYYQPMQHTAVWPGTCDTVILDEIYYVRVKSYTLLYVVIGAGFAVTLIAGVAIVCLVYIRLGRRRYTEIQA